MKKKPITKEQLLVENEDLRRRLEEAEETLRAIHEGEVDALVLSKPHGEVVFTLKGAEHPYRVFVEAMNEGAVTLDPEGTILYCNNHFAEMLEIPADRVIGSSIHQFIPSTDRSGFESAFQEAKQQDTTADISLKREDEELIPVHLSFNMLRGQEMPVLCMVAMDLTEHKRLEETLRQFNALLEKRIEDRTAELVKANETLRAEITERKRVEEALRESEQRWATTLASIGDAVIATCEEGRIRFMNAVAEELTGWRLSEASQKPAKQVFKIINEQTRLEVEDPVGRVIGTGMICGLANHTLLVRKDGTEVAIDDSGAPITDETGKTMGVVLVFRDISERRRVEKELQRYRGELELLVQERTHELELTNEELKVENRERLDVEIELRESETRLRQLSMELLSAQEKERRLVAQEIHDSIGATLAATRFRVEEVVNKVGENSPQTREALASILPMLQETIQETRRIQMNLRPAILDDLGILATIRWFCRQYESTYSAIRIRQEIDIQEEDVADSLKTVIFRVSQEALNNIAKHSKASEVHLSLSKIERTIRLVIRDNGQGFDPSEAHSRNGTSRGLGLVGMQDRVELSGGSFQIESSIGAGTVIRASWPL
jgi:PAS domain S-box-containing protein